MVPHIAFGKGGGPKSWHRQAFEKPGQAQATRPPNVSFVSPNPVTIQYLPINITWASGGPSPGKLELIIMAAVVNKRQLMRQSSLC